MKIRPTLLALAGLMLLVAPAHAVTPEWAERWRADLRFAADTLPRVHPNLYHSVSRERFAASLDSLAARLDRLDDEAITVELSRIVALVGDGHTRLTLPYDSTAGFFTGHASTAAPRIPGLVFPTLPVRLGRFAEGVFVVATTAEHRALLGARVLELGERPIADALAAVEPVVARDNASQVRARAMEALVTPAVLRARGVSAARDRIRIVAEPLTGSRREATLAPLPAEGRPAWIPARNATPIADREPGRAHRVERLADGVVYARLREIGSDDHETMDDFAARVAEALKAPGARALLLDVRGNPGGDGFLNRPLVRAILRWPGVERPGSLFVLEDGGTFSAAVMLLAELERYAGPVMAGEKSGGAPNGYGDSRRIRLPNSGLTIRVSSLEWQTTDPRDDRDGFAPLVSVEPRYDAWTRGGDAALEEALRWLDERGSMNGRWRGEAALGGIRFPVEFTIAEGSAPSLEADIPALGIQAKAPEIRVDSRTVRGTFDSPQGPITVVARSSTAGLVGHLWYAGSPIPFVATASTAESQRE